MDPTELVQNTRTVMRGAALLVSSLLLTSSVSHAEPPVETWVLVTNGSGSFGEVSWREEVTASSREECVRFLEDAIESKASAMRAFGRRVDVHGAIVIARHPADERVVSATMFTCRGGS